MIRARRRLGLTAAIVAAWLGVGCTGEGGEATAGCTPGAEGCGCAGEGRCEAGLLCKQEVCVPAPDPTDATGEGSTGSTSAGESTTDDTSDGSTSGSHACMCHHDCDRGFLCNRGECQFDPAVCGEATIQIPLPRTDVVLVVDKSRSMVAESWDDDGDPNTPGEVTRWSSLHAALEPFAATYDEVLQLGEVLAPSYSASDESAAAACPVAASPEVAVGPLNGAAVLQSLPPASATKAELGGATPTRAAIEVAVAHLLAQGDGLPRSIVLITDGAANCSADAIDEPSHFELFDAAIVDVIADAAAQGIRTHVVGVDVGPGVSPMIVDGEPDGVDLQAILNGLALAGGAAKDDPEERFHNAHDGVALAAAMSAVAGAIIPCTVELDPPPLGPEDVSVYAGGVDLGFDQVEACASEDGWRFTDEGATAIELCGTACAAVQAQGWVEVYYHCHTGPPPEPPGCR